MATIEQKAIAYDKAIEKIKYAMDHGVQPVLNKEDLLDIFTELKEKENEDERIRKEILDYIDKATGCKRWVAWLEKQGESIDKITQRARTEKQRVLLTETNGEANIDWDTRSVQDVKLLLEYGLDYIKKFENQGEQKASYTTIVETGDGGINALVTRELPTDGEQNPADKVEPKFKVGDWCIDNEDGTIFQIVKVLDNTYKYRTNEGKEYSCTHYSLELDARLWNIQDSKDGDVLVDSLGNVCIYQEPSTKLMYHSHCYGNHKGFMYMGGSHEIVGSYPATKEQRDKLEKAMANAGYAFDFEKKELREIENEEYDGDDYGIDSLWHAKNILEKTIGKVDGYQTDDGILDHKCAITAVDKLYKNSIAWSEKDKHWIQKVIDFMNHPDLIKATPTLAKDTINWLKSLKDRVQPQSKQKWSEEDESNFQGIIDVIKAH